MSHALKYVKWSLRSKALRSDGLITSSLLILVYCKNKPLALFKSYLITPNVISEPIAFITWDIITSKQLNLLCIQGLLSVWSGRSGRCKAK
ncbi:hypothetical protein BD408DRAFT_426521 [Parasitella parasitica]|nr:hypothetical protein BD408DRAFT_426521 [Parasitella parasitica]